MRNTTNHHSGSAPDLASHPPPIILLLPASSTTSFIPPSLTNHKPIRLTLRLFHPFYFFTSGWTTVRTVKGVEIKLFSINSKLFAPGLLGVNFKLLNFTLRLKSSIKNEKFLLFPQPLNTCHLPRPLSSCHKDLVN